LQLLALSASHGPHAFAPVPHWVAVGAVTHELPLQHPVEQFVLLQP
jgi:hypothetical protein